ncbi:helix-turn-helix domain-containing protein [Enterococcus devriesei]|uniref:Mga helix-turn-helix domain-containing protein n=1 Tax=Enterococcus devriesei TaxID=319970 RepID=A0A1L8SW70_9ENTE|nr:helix-turn-helix domain-containing protein [Enterococcus devriesei]OJG36310.1 hypothetical protein RV00_GL001669 [Enterococcus devriesei]
MQANDLLMEDDRYKWYLLQYLELNKTAYSSVEQIGDLLEISRYKVEKYIQELQIELKEVTDETLIEIQDTGKITVQRLNHAIVKKMRLLLIERSISYQIFHRYVTKETSLDKQIEELHLSRSSTYRLYKKLKEQLADEGFQLKKNQLSGSELKIRSFLFGIYYEIFNGLANPFDEEIQQQSKELFRYLIHHLNLSIPKTKEHKLIYFISIALLRMRKGHVIDEVFIEYTENDATHYLVKWLKQHYDFTAEEQQKEIAALLLFCHLSEIPLEQKLTFLDHPSNQQAAELTTTFFKYLAEHSNFGFDALRQNWSLGEGLLRINQKWLIYHLRETTFVTKIQRRYFQEINPKLDQMIQDFIEEMIPHGLFQSDQERNKLYYDYLFFLITQISVEELEKPIFICIDFSHGNSYNDYIRTMLRSLQSMNISYEEKLTNRTQIYLSDFLIDTLPCQQMIWKRPPTPEDWAEFGHLLLTVKGNAYG